MADNGILPEEQELDVELRLAPEVLAATAGGPSTQNTPKYFVGQVLGEGTEDDPQWKVRSPRQTEPRNLWPNAVCSECQTVWFVPSQKNQRRCFTCGAKYRVLTKKKVTLRNKDGNYEVEQHVARAVIALKKSGAELDDTLESVKFGDFGNIVCSKRQIAAARMFAEGSMVKLNADNEEQPLTVDGIAAACFIAPPDLRAMLDGGGPQPRFLDMVAYFRIQSVLTYQMGVLIPEARRAMMTAEGKDRTLAAQRIVGLESEVWKRLPSPPTRVRPEFGWGDGTIPENARERHRKWLRTLPGVKGKYKGGPGPEK